MTSATQSTRHEDRRQISKELQIKARSVGHSVFVTPWTVAR